MRNGNKLTVGLAILATLMMVDSALAYYNPRTGRFLSRDPVGEPGAILIREVAATTAFIPRDPGGAAAEGNTYRYANNSPAVYIDPHGLWGRETHYQGTYDMAKEVGFNDRCAQVLAEWDQGVDAWTGASLFTWYHFNKDVDGRPYSCGRDCWFQKRWGKGVEKLRAATAYYSWFEVSVYDGLAHIGESLHHRQDSFAHNASHNAETPFDHAPSVICLLWGDGFGIIYQRCIDARQNNPNWSNPHRPDDPGQWPSDHAATLADTKRLLEQIWNIPAVRCYCCGK
jgi:hypothetical protein